MSHLTMMIEMNRKKMIELSAQYGMGSIEVVKCSQELDVLIHRLMNEKTKPFSESYLSHLKA